MDASIINPFISATINVIETMAFLKAKAGKPFLKKMSSFKFFGRINERFFATILSSIHGMRLFENLFNPFLRNFYQN